MCVVEKSSISSENDDEKKIEEKLTFPFGLDYIIHMGEKNY
jgi:hypothetical protein